MFVGQNGFILDTTIGNCVLLPQWPDLSKTCSKLCVFAKIALFRPNHTDQMSQTGKLVKKGHYE